MADLLFQIEATLRRDGLRIYSDKLIIDQRLGKGEKVLSVEELTEISTNRSIYDMPFLEQSLAFRASGKKYVLRRLPKKECQKAKEVLIGLI